MITERQATLDLILKEKITRKVDVFYNPLMRRHRDISILLLLARAKKNLDVADPLAGSGVRSIRFLKELPEDMIASLAVNDRKVDFPKEFEKNLVASGIDPTPAKVTITTQDAQLFLLSQKKYDYIDIDPFGSPNPFLDSAMKAIRKNGVLAVTATDTAPLCGTYPLACKRKYFATPLRESTQHEVGLRILIRKVQLIGAQYALSLTPIYSYSAHHYLRVFFEVQHGKQRCDDILAKQTTYKGAGPLWGGPLWDKDLAKTMASNASTYPEEKKFLELVALEAALEPVVGFFDVHELSRKFHLKAPPKNDAIIAALKSKGYPATQTHFLGQGIRTTAQQELVEEVIQNC